jgi:hypothetical protein
VYIVYCTAVLTVGPDLVYIVYMLYMVYIVYIVQCSALCSAV